MTAKPTIPKLDLALLPTRIEHLKATSERTGHEIWIKRDDQTGLELSGNKVRKLEYALADAIDKGCDTIVTAGAMQSNHCRATAAACARLGLGCVLLLAGDKEASPDGNHLLARLFGATIRLLSPAQYHTDLADQMEQAAAQLKEQSKTPYLIPVGASNGIGTYGYFSAMAEIQAQEKEMGVEFDTIVCAVGSGGTYAGLALADHALGLGRRIIGVPVAKDNAYFKQRILAIAQEFSALYGPVPLAAKDICLLDGHVGLGYGLSRIEELSFLQDFARREGILLDPVYTGKAMLGLVKELQMKNPVLAGSRRILFIHTGGLFGLFPKREQFEF